MSLPDLLVEAAIEAVRCAEPAWLPPPRPASAG